MKLTITLDGVTRNYELDKDTIFENDWNEIVENMLDTVESVG